MSDMRKLLESMTKFAGEPAQRPGDQVRGTEQAKKKKSGQHPFQGRLVGGESIIKELEKQLVEGDVERRLREEFEQFNEFASNGGGDGGNYFRELASAWYNGTFDSGSLQKGIKSQQDVERLLNRGIVCPDGKTRKLHIDYNSDFDGVEIYSDDYYEYGDYDDTIDSRTGQKWGPYDFMAFSDEDLSEGLNEFAVGGGSGRWYTDDQMTDLVGDGWWQDMDVSGANIGVPDSEVPKEYMIKQAQRWLKRQGHDVQVLNVKLNDDDCEWYIEGAFPKDLTEFAADDGDSGEDDVLRKYAQMWWNGDNATQQKIEAVLARMGWEIGEDEGGYDNGGVFVVRAGDEHGKSYTSWAAEDLTEGKPKEKEADYGADYQDMVSRVKKLAGLGPLKTVYDPQKRVYKNVPTAVQPKKEQR